jgi:hypothetical protein
MQQAQAAPDGVKGNWRVLTSLALRSDDNSRALSALVLNVMIILKNQECTESPGLVPNFSPKFHYAKRRFSVTSKCRHMYEVLNVDEIKN